MNTLIINTAFNNANYILTANDDFFDITTPSSAKHSETSLLKIDELLSQANIRIYKVYSGC